MKKSETFLTAKEQQLLKEANRIFIDAQNYDYKIVLGCYNVLKVLFPTEELPKNSATVGGLELIRARLDEYYDKIIYYHYFLGLSYSDISRNIPFAPSKIRDMEAKCLQFLWSHAKDFYFPLRQEFIAKYHIFLSAIQKGVPSNNDIPILNLGLSTHTVTALHKGEVFTASQMYLLENSDLIRLRGLGTSSIAEITNTRKKLLTGQL